VAHNEKMIEHHALVCFVDKVSVVLSELIEKDSFFKEKEIERIEIEKFGIDNSRYLIEQAFLRPVIFNKKLIIVSFSAITVEAEQALLKILEEPPLTTQFLFFLPKGINLLPTLNSRLQTIEFTEFVEKESRKTEILESFLKLSVKDRIAQIEKELKKENSEWVRDLKSDLLLELERGSKKYSLEVLESLNFVVTNLNTRGAANKMLLEELALILPD